MIGEVRLFWYRQQKCINYFISNIEKNDEVAYLAGAVRLDIGRLFQVLCKIKKLI